MPADTYKTIEACGEATQRVRGSAFYGSVCPVTTQPEAEEALEDVRASHPDATHHVPAYRVRTSDDEGGVFLREYQSDDGEPSGSAGPPALNVLQGQSLENVVAVVARYYGGTNLGVGGLARAYASTVTAAIGDTETITQHPQREVVITVSYDDSGTVRNILESTELQFEGAYEETVSFRVIGDKPAVAELLDRVRSRTSDRAVIGE